MITNPPLRVQINKPKQLVKYTIMSLSHLLSANVNSALEYFSQMGYHDDIDTRRAFLKVITNILDQGAEFDKGEEDLRDKYEALLELLFEQNMLVTQALLQGKARPSIHDVLTMAANSNSNHRGRRRHARAR